MRKLIFVFLFLIATAVSSQELNCTVQVLSQQVQGTETRVFQTLETAIFEFMNNTKWTGDAFTMDERIECSIMINVTERISNDQFKATMSIQSRRPIFNTSYNSVMLNYNDNDFTFKYLEYQPLEFSLNAFNSNLTSVLAFYAYIIIGLDYDSFALQGGTPHFQKSQTIVANAQGTGGNEEAGWKAHLSIKNRYWYVENMINLTFEPIRSANYIIHRKALDKMSENMDEARLEVINALEGLKTVHKIKPTSYNMQMFFNAKSDEMVSIFTKAMPAEKQKAVQILSEIDPGNLTKYQKILTAN
ncbi:MAG: DUF4835 family protein [Bacteroidetes bacterium]|nr:DUF4835 family protein [Bacteroidota bacterium]HET6244073.1 DUF4835 family protein [Bacteroidia bacterium]